MSNTLSSPSLPVHARGDDPALAFIGCGTVGRSLGRLFNEAGLSIRGICCRTRASALAACRFIGAGRPFSREDTAKAAASAPFIIMATPDREIHEADAATATGLREGAIVIHVSGALSSGLLVRCREAGARVGSMHPLQSFADARTALKSVPGSIFTCEGDDEAVKLAYWLAGRIGGRPIRIDTASKPLYHAAAAAASNFLIAPLLLALDLMESAGIAKKESMEALEPLILGTVRNAALVGVPGALTGPIERGDCVVVKGHLEAIRRIRPDLKPAYVALGRLTVEAARRKGSLDEKTAEALLDILKE